MTLSVTSRESGEEVRRVKANQKECAICHRGTDSAKIVHLIQTVAPMGSGTEDDPVRLVRQFWTLDGKPVFQLDYHFGDI